MVGFLSNAFTTGHQVKDELNGHVTDIKHFSVHGMTGVYMTMFNTHSARTGAMRLVSHHLSSLSPAKF
jgi:beta-glucosidase-like glycosyl hydrolase